MKFAFYVALAVGLGPALPNAASGKSPTCPADQSLRNEATARIVFEEMLSRGRISENENIYHPDFVVHGASGDLGRTEDRAAAEGWRRLAPDLKVTVQHIVSNCDLVAVHWLSTGTTTGTGNGLKGTGRPVRLPGMTFFRMSGGQIVEEWSAWDNSALMRQIGPQQAGGQ